MIVLSRTLVPGALGSSMVASGCTTLLTSCCANHSCVRANVARVSLFRLSTDSGELYCAPAAAWDIVCDSPLWCDHPDAGSGVVGCVNFMLKSAVGYIGISAMTCAALQISA